MQILSDVRSASHQTNVRSKVAQELIDELSVYNPDAGHRLLIDRDVRCSIEELTDWWETSNFGLLEMHKLAPKAIDREVTKHLEATGRHWRTHALAQLARFEGPPTVLDAWLQQFGTLGCSQIGRKIAAQLHVIKTGDFPHAAFRMRPTDLIGRRRAHCYIEDDDMGGSWGEMRALLTHACPPASVFPVRWNEANGTIDFPAEEMDEIIIHEDGLWSGHETVRRLQTIAAAPPSASITLKYGVVSDFGLMVTRQAIRSLGLSGKVSVDPSASEVVHFLKSDIDESLRFGLGMKPDEYYQALHAYVEPRAFCVPNLWSQEEIALCEDIGGQLVRHWLTKKDGEQPSEDKVKKYSLGGGRFASTVLFSRSVPKVCLPLLWLDGPVILQSKHVNWRPLFVDARRVSNSSLLLASSNMG
ncbi:hypothetical protein G6L25_16875 [Agrobacterium rhizogenes]|nr:hypothetical protein [Rhizobium rhizogenes]